MGGNSMAGVAGAQNMLRVQLPLTVIERFRATAKKGKAAVLADAGLDTSAFRRGMLEGFTLDEVDRLARAMDTSAKALVTATTVARVAAQLQSA